MLAFISKIIILAVFVLAAFKAMVYFGAAQKVWSFTVGQSLYSVPWGLTVAAVVGCFVLWKFNPTWK